ncbi:hypothetical protein HFP15_40055 [Amycolatopsis sp. K13G38]|uniref:DUF222 domain-containing protein n=1 Tax=Amycolatopsis acididurans TaxID=2724524 RepID=A0ABX1JGX4_9PSEU|nr:hypothetical protein [Amycolatopsis acididurans]NKQ59055.1 hypothetical protein [Amycolatopsis acididurans]
MGTESKQLDPDVTLVAMRRLLSDIDAMTAKAIGEDDDDQAERWFESCAALRTTLADRFADLDEWLSGGGTLPKAWTQAPVEAVAETGTWEERTAAAVRELFSVETAREITEGEAFGPLVYRLRRYCEANDATAREALEAIDADARAFADTRADNPAAFLAKQLRELAGE